MYKFNFIIDIIFVCVLKIKFFVFNLLFFMHKILSLNLLILLYLNIVLFHFYYIYFSFILHFKFLFDFCNFYWYTKLKGGILMEILDSNIESLETSEEIITENTSEIQTEPTSSTQLIEYKEIDEPCVALTIIGENRLTDAEVFVRRGFKFSLKAFFSTLMLTIMNMFI